MGKILKRRNQFTMSKWMRDKIYEKYNVLGREFCLAYYMTSDFQINQIILENCYQTNKLHLGYKLDSYHTEDEMINGFSCAYEQLSDSEKLIYDNL